MSLATRCTECGTVFRVVPDQLKVSEGWVRCGRCTGVFNAAEHLFDLDAPAGHDESTSAGAVLSDSPQTVPPDPDAADAAASSLAAPAGVPDPFAAEVPQPIAVPDDAAPGGPPEVMAGTRDFAITIDDSPAVRVTISQPASADAAPPLQVDADETTPTPTFMRAGNDDSWWHRPPVRGALVGVAVALSGLLAVQSAMIWRDEWVARVPAIRPALEALCEPLGCRVTAVRRIDSLSIDASGLSRIEGSELHRLSLTLRNRAQGAVLAPAIELTLTDPSGSMLARRVLTLDELGRPVTLLGPGEELPLQALLSADTGRVNGYTVELFYP